MVSLTQGEPGYIYLQSHLAIHFLVREPEMDFLCKLNPSCILSLHETGNQDDKEFRYRLCIILLVPQFDWHYLRIVLPLAITFIFS